MPRVKGAYYTLQTDFETIKWKSFRFHDMIYWTAKERLEEFCQNLGLIPKIPGKCECNLPLTVIPDSRAYFRKSLRCVNRCRKVPYLRNTYFEGSHLLPGQIIMQLYCSAVGLNQDNQMIQTKINSAHSIVEWENFHRNVAVIILHHDNDIIGGPGKIVELDEFHVYTKESCVGHLLKNETCWVFIGIERGSNKSFLRVVEKRDADTLIPIIQKKVALGSVICTDNWPAYDSLGALGYTHHNSIHREYYVDPSDGTIQTQNEKSTWNHIKEVLLKGLKSKLKASYLAKYLYERKFEWGKKHPGDKFKQLCDHISRVFPGPGYVSIMNSVG